MMTVVAHTATRSLSWRSRAHTKGEFADGPQPQLYKPADSFKWPDRIALSPAEVSLIAVCCFSPRISIQP